MEPHSTHQDAKEEIIWPPPGPSILDRPESFHLSTDKSYPGVGWKRTGTVQQVTSATFPVLQGTGFCTFVYEFFEQSMRVLHWHDFAEMGIAQSGVIDVYLFETPSQHSIFRIHPGQAWFIPKGALHSLNAIGDEKATMIISWNGDQQNAFDLPVIFNALPQDIRIAYTQRGKHAALSHYVGPEFNVVSGFNPLSSVHNPLLQKKSPYKFDLRRSKPLFFNKKLGLIQHATESTWPILREQKISPLFAVLRPKVFRDMIWYPNSDILYTITQGKGKFWIVIPGWEPKPFDVRYHDMILVRSNLAHTFQNTDNAIDLHVVGIFNQSNPKGEVSLGVSTNFFPKPISNASLSLWGNHIPTHNKNKKDEQPLEFLKNFHQNPYLLPGSKKKHGKKKNKSHILKQSNHVRRKNRVSTKKLKI